MAAALELEIGKRVLARAGTLAARLASSAQDVEAAQRLRYRVFADELGARLRSTHPGCDTDRFDEYCRHLIVEDTTDGEVVGTYRVLLPEQARRAGGLYIDGEFCTEGLGSIRDDLIELGRACVHPAYRSGAAIMLLWSGLGVLVGRLPYRHLVGCVSVTMSDGGHFAASLYRRLAESHASREPYRVVPKERLPIEDLFHGCDVVVPPLVKAYLRAGARLIGEPHHDRDFACADFPILLAVDRLAGRHVRRFIRGY